MYLFCLFEGAGAQHIFISNVQTIYFILYGSGCVCSAYPLTTTPPLGCKHCPEMKLLSGLARNTKQVATSLGCPGRPIGTAWNCSMAEVFIVDGIRGVQTVGRLVSNQRIIVAASQDVLGPGQTQLTRIPFLTCWLDRPRVNATMAPLVDV